MKQSSFPIGAILATLAGLAGCGAGNPTPELVDARRSYDEARTGKAAQLVPDQVLSAKQALDKAEAAHEDDSGSFQEKSLAYVAQRKAQLAISLGGQAEAQRQIAAADQAYKDTQDKLRKAAEGRAADNARRLEQVRKALAEQGDKLSAQSQALKKQEADLMAQQKTIETERNARMEAERKLAAAMKSLEEIARVKEESRGLVITLDGSVLFASGKTALLPIAEDKLSRVAEVLQQQDPSKKIVVEGHTDSVGTDADNQRLSQARADSVRAFLISKGVESDRISAVGRGEGVPIADNKTPEGRANNRRVEIIVK
jgi:outer membrane protein OmpA-like peptidoglycan-associated protein